MGAQHTPGPWEIPTPSFGFSAITTATGDLIFGLAAGAPNEKQSDDVCEANARLIAAAPDLLAVAQRFIDFAKSGAGFNYPLGSLHELERAIAKATGA